MLPDRLFADGWFNSFVRIFVAISIRVRGNIYLKSGVFNNAKGSKLFLGRYPEIKNGKNILLRGKSYFGNNARLEVIFTGSYDKRVRMEFGENTSFGNNFHCGASNCIQIGDNVLGGSNILITDHSHGRPKADLSRLELIAPNQREVYSKGPIIIGSNVWIADGVVILGGVTIGDGAIISANSVVRESVPERTIF